MSWYGGYEWRPYVSVAARRARAQKRMEELRRQGKEIHPVEIQGRTIARTFWGKAWCGHLESFSDYENRLPRGRTYVRNGSVCHLGIANGAIEAMVAGSELYTVAITIETLERARWEEVKRRCAGQVGSLLDLLQGRLSDGVMSVVTDRDRGLFPLPGEISMSCSCPDWAAMCKHVAAVLYGVGARLDEKPELLFLLRGVSPDELIADSAQAVAIAVAGSAKAGTRIAPGDLAELFGIEVATESPVSSAARRDRTPKKPAPGKHPARKPSRRPKDKSPGLPRHDLPVGNGFTGADVARLRARFEMSRSEFAVLLGVSVQTVANWEGRDEPLGLHARTASALAMAKRLSKRAAWRRLEEV